MREGFRLFPGRASEPRNRWIPFWVLQVLEVVVALILVDVSIHVHDPGLLLVAAVALVVLALIADGPLGIFRIVNRHLHLLMTIGVAALVALAPTVPGFRPDIEGIIVLEFGMIGIIRVATLTSTTATGAVVPSTGGRWSSGRRPTVVDATATVVDGSRPPQPGPPRGTDSPAADTDDSPVRRAGRATGAAVATGKKAAARYRPEAEAHLRRTIREAGRWAGKITKPSDSDTPD
jgi:hypothetical protein